MSVWREGVRFVESLSGLGAGLSSVAVGLVVFLAGATVVRGVSLLLAGNSTARNRWRSVATWWILTVLFLVLLVLGPPAVTVTMALLSTLLWREAIRLVDAEGLLLPGLGALAGVYAWAWLDGDTLFLRVLPGVTGILLAVEAAWRMAEVRGAPDWLGRARALGGAVFLALVGPSYVVAVAALPAPSQLPASGMGWFALLFLLTELNDSAQAWGGRALGVRRMAPTLSPGKTWAGFWSGVATTTLAAVLVAPLLTSWGRGDAPFSPTAGPGIASSPGGSVPLEGGILGAPWMWSAGLGILIALSGVAGDLLESSLKRRAGVKDSGDILPGHGGLMDRFDSLALTAPVFFAVTWILWF